MSVIVSSLRCLSRSIELTCNAGLSLVTASAMAVDQISQRSSNFVVSSAKKYDSLKSERLQELAENISETKFYRQNDHEEWLKHVNATFSGKKVAYKGQDLSPEELYNNILKELEANNF